MTQFEVSYASPFINLYFEMFFILAVWLFDEAFAAQKMIVLGVVITGRSA